MLLILKALSGADAAVLATQLCSGEMRQESLVLADTSQACLGEADQTPAREYHHGHTNLPTELDQAGAQLRRLTQIRRVHPVPVKSAVVPDLACCAVGKVGTVELLLGVLELNHAVHAADAASPGSGYNAVMWETFAPSLWALTR